MTGAIDFDIPVPMPKITRMGEVRNPQYPPLRAIEHLANARPTVPADGGVPASNAAESDYWAGRRRSPRKSLVWSRLSVQGRADHIDICPDTCRTCEDHRAFGTCTSCGALAEAVGVDELSRCCGSRVFLGGVA